MKKRVPAVIEKLRRLQSTKQQEIQDLQGRVQRLQGESLVARHPECIKWHKQIAQVKKRLHHYRINITKKSQSIQIRQRHLADIQQAVESYKQLVQQAQKEMQEMEYQLAEARNRVISEVV